MNAERIDRRLAPVLAALVLALGLLFAFACGSNGPDSTFAPPDSGADPASFTLRVDPASSSETTALGAPGKVVQFRAFRRDPNAAEEVEVTAQATWAIANKAMAQISGSGSFALLGIGGVTSVQATLEGTSGSADLTVKATGDILAPGTPPDAPAKFAAASPDTTPSSAPLAEYPLDGVVLPGNLPPVEFQWSQAADNNLYRIHLTTPGTLDVNLYTTARELAADAATWSALSKSSLDAPVTWAVEAIGPSNQLRKGPPRTLTPSADTIDDSAIYVWQPSTGTFRVIDMIKQTDVAFPTNSASLQKGQPCAGCHRISRDGKRFSFTFNGAAFQFGTLVYNAATQSFDEKIGPKATYRGTYATFNPLEATQIPAMIVAEPDDVEQNAAGTVRLNVRNPDTGAILPSNLPTMLGSLPKPNPGGATSMPDWAPDGSFVVYAAYNNDLHFVREVGDDIVLASIVESSVSFAGGTFTFGAPKVLVAASSADNPDTGQNNFLPSVAPDGTAVAFTRSAGWWSIKTQASTINLSGQIMLVRRSDGKAFELVKGSNGAGTQAMSTWPQWAPSVGKKYAWLAYSSERPYGHRLDAANHSCGALVQGQQSCKQLWVMAVDLSKMHAGSEDPSLTPFWIPGQNIHEQYVSPQWTRAVAIAPR